MLREQIDPFYFGPSDKSLFGCYQAPLSGASRDCGVVLCYPMGEAYNRFHRAYRQLASRLAQAGFPVLRFDFYGCGDSDGACTQGRIEQWLMDITAAIGELRRRREAARVCLIGIGLGGALSMIAGATRGDIDSMVLWDPVVSGRAYLEELIAMHREMLRYAHVQPKRRTPDERGTEILGFPLTEAMLTDIRSIDLLATQQKPAHHILVIESHTKVSQERLARHLKRMGARVERHQLLDPRLWDWVEDLGKVLVPHQILQSIVSWLSEAYA